MINVIDSIMGSGKSQSAIAYMNEHKDRKFIYITPYLDEGSRISAACPDLHFVEPSDKLSKYRFSKSLHSLDLMKRGENISSTHAMFKLYTQEMIDIIREHHYTMIIDEALEVFTEANFNLGDIKILEESGYIKYENEGYTTTGKQSTGKRFTELFNMIKRNNLIRMDDTSDKTFYWSLPKEVILAMDDVFILTYLFKAQDLGYYFQINNIEYHQMGIRKYGDMDFRFSELTPDFPKYTLDIKDKIHIIDKNSLNDIGSRRNALSKSWYINTSSERIDRLRKNMYNFMSNDNRGISGDKKMWATFDKQSKKITGKGYARGWVIWNKKATNEFRDRQDLAYLVNIFAKPEKARYFTRYGITYDTDAYALSEMVQWIWRSAIRDGKEIWIYVPSKRMRDLLINWVEEVSN